MDSTRELLLRYSLTPRKSLGQNFLIHKDIASRIVQQANLGIDDTVLEIGAGLGTLTTELAACAGQVIAVETDPHLTTVLHSQLDSFSNIRIVHGDMLKLDPVDLLDNAPTGTSSMPLWGELFPNYHVVANLPYYITAAVLRHVLESSVRPKRMVVTVQREVAQRMVALPGDMSLLAVSIQFYAKPRIVMRLKRGVFFPPPNVESAVVRLDLHDAPPVPVTDVARFFQVVRAGFAQRRKQLRNTLASNLKLSPEVVVATLTQADVDPTRRAETLSLAEWGRVVAALSPTPPSVSS